MKKIYFLMTAVCLLFLSTGAFAQLSGTVTVGNPGGAFPSFTGAGGLFQAINTVGLSGNLTVAVVNNTTENGSNLLNQFSGGYIIYITPSSATTYTFSGTGLAVPMMTINGADKIYFEGSFGGSGQYLIFQNYNSINSGTTPCLQLQEDVRGVAVRNCIFRSNAGILTNPCICLGSTSGPLGNDSIYINNNRFEGINAERYNTAIYNSSILTGAQRNSEIAITKNTFTKFRPTSAAIVDLSTAGVGDSINVDSNFFYNDTTHIVGLSFINFNSATSVYNSFSFNSMGGSAANRSGAAFLINAASAFRGIKVTTSSASLSTIRGNQISNISGADLVTVNTITGIEGTGRLEILNNVIGGGANPWDTIHNSYDNGFITIGGGATDTINCYNNTISNCTYYRKKNDRLCGILINTGLRVNVYNNIISNFNGNNTAASTSFNIFGIRTAGTTVNDIINIYNNTLSNFNNFSDSSVVNAYTGIIISNSVATATVNVYNNKLYDFRTSNANTGANSMTIYGIQDASTSGLCNIYNNAISFQTSNGNEAVIKGIACTAANLTLVHNINYNSVYVAGTASALASTNSYGFYRGSTGLDVLRNNIFCTNRGNQTSFPIGVASATNWVDTTSNYNLFVSLSSANIGTFVTTTPMDFATWKTNTLGDNYSLAENTTNVVPSNLWTSIANAGLFVNSFQAEAWYIFGQGTPVTYPLISTDFSGTSRSTTIAGGPTTIGCAQSPLPSSGPPTITNTITGFGVYNFLFGGKPIANIQINPPTSGFNFNISLKHFGGKTPPSALAPQQFALMYDSIYVSSGTPATINYDISLFAYPNQLYNIVNPTNIRVAKSSDQGVSWNPLLSGSYFGGTPGYGYANGLNSFSIFTLTSTDAPLPVELSSFNSSVNRNTVTLNWSTISEINNSGFDIERKPVNTESWTKVGFTAGKGTTSLASAYKFTENIAGKGKYNYRLKQIDNNGNFKYYQLSNLVEVGVPHTFNLSQNYPNPFNPTTKIDFDLPLDSKVTLVLFDITGREVMTLLNGDFRESGYYTQQINASALSSGTYFYRLNVENGSNNFVQTKKMMLVK